MFAQAKKFEISEKTSLRVSVLRGISHAITFHALQNRKICNVNHGVKNSVNCSPLEVKVHMYVQGK